MERPFMFLVKLAWACRYRLPVLITIAFVALDIRMQLDIHVQMRRVRRPTPTAQNLANHDNYLQNDETYSEDYSSDSWITTEDSDDGYGEEGNATYESSSLARQTDTNGAYSNFLTIN